MAYLSMTQDVIKFMIGDEPELLDEAIPKLPKYLYEKYNVVKSDTFYLEFLNKNCDKWIGIEKIAEYLGITKDAAIVLEINKETKYFKIKEVKEDYNDR